MTGGALMSQKHEKIRKEYFDERPLEEVWENMYCDPLDCDERVYSSKIKEKQRYQEKKEENDGFFEQERLI